MVKNRPLPSVFSPRNSAEHILVSHNEQTDMWQLSKPTCIGGQDKALEHRRTLSDALELAAGYSHPTRLELRLRSIDSNRIEVKLPMFRFKGRQEFDYTVVSEPKSKSQLIHWLRICIEIDTATVSDLTGFVYCSVSVDEAAILFGV